MKAVQIPVHGNRRIVEVDDDQDTRFLTDLRSLIGAGCHAVEPVELTSRLQTWVDEDGIAAGLPVNPAATALARAYGLTINLRGTAILLGINPADATSQGLSDDQIQAIHRLIIGAT